MNEAKVSIRVRDEGGRTPLHDAAWTDRPNFDLVKIILKDSPELMFVKDDRRYSPLSYVAPAAVLYGNLSGETKLR